MSRSYETSSQNPGVIANNKGDWGGASYGMYQIATNTGTMNNFLNYLKKTNSKMYNMLSKYKPGTAAFNTAWKGIAGVNPAGFTQVQHGFIQATHYDPAARSIKSALGVDVNKLSKAMKDVLWSTSVQHGAGGALNVFKGAGIKPGMSEAEMIRRIYAERGANNGKKYFSRSSPSIRASVVNRFKSEVKDALKMLG